jgi:hypothetical protein
LKIFLKFQEGIELVLVELCFGENFAGLFLLGPKIGIGGLCLEFLDFLSEKGDVKDTS